MAGSEVPACLPACLPCGHRGRKDCHSLSLCCVPAPIPRYGVNPVQPDEPPSLMCLSTRLQASEISQLLPALLPLTHHHHHPFLHLCIFSVLARAHHPVGHPGSHPTSRIYLHPQPRSVPCPERPGDGARSLQSQSLQQPQPTTRPRAEATQPGRARTPLLPLPGQGNGILPYSVVSDLQLPCPALRSTFISPPSSSLQLPSSSMLVLCHLTLPARANLVNRFPGTLRRNGRRPRSSLLPLD